MKQKTALSLINIFGVAAGFQIGTFHPRSIQDRPRPLYAIPNTNDGETDTSVWNPKLRRKMGAIAAAGSIETAYLTFTELTGTNQLCSSDGGCSDILNGPYSVVPGTDIPLAALGFLAYTATVALALGPVLKTDGDDKQNRVLLTALTTSMGIFSVFLMTVLSGVLKQSCPYCVASAILSVALANLAWLGGSLPKENVKNGIVASAGGGLTAFVAAAVLYLTTEAPPVNYAGKVTSPSATTSTLLADNTAMKGQTPPPISTTSSARALRLAEDLGQLNTRFFGAFWCTHCFDQKEELGREAMGMIPYIECSKDGFNSQNKVCKERDVPGYPTWEINGKLYPGQRDLSELEEIVQEARRS